MKKKFLTILFASVLSAGMLTGCFGNNRENDNNSTQNSVMDDTANNVDENSGATDTTNNVNQNDTNNTTDNKNNTVTDGTTGNGTDDRNDTIGNNGTTNTTTPDDTTDKTTGNKNKTNTTLISEKEASEIALSHIKGADTSHLNIHQETEDGRAIYEGTITYNDREHHFEIDADSGEILEWDMELLTR